MARLEVVPKNQLHEIENAFQKIRGPTHVVKKKMKRVFIFPLSLFTELASMV
jgi:hypothetical protein